MNNILLCGVLIILGLAGLGVYLGWAAYHERAKRVVRDIKGEEV